MKNYKQDWLFPIRSKILLITIITAIILFCKCGPVLYMPVATDAQRVGTTLDTLLQGRRLYVNNCASCHSLYSPERYSANEWQTYVNRMQKKAKINDAQKENILKYLISKCRG